MAFTVEARNCDVGRMPKVTMGTFAPWSYILLYLFSCAAESF